MFYKKKKKKKGRGSNKMEKKQNEDRCENINNDIIWDDCFLGIKLFSLYVWILSFGVYVPALKMFIYHIPVEKAIHSQRKGYS